MRIGFSTFSATVLAIWISLLLLPVMAKADHLHGDYQGNANGDRVNVTLQQNGNQLNGTFVSSSGEHFNLRGEVDAQGIGLLAIENATGQWQAIRLQVWLDNEQTLQLNFIEQNAFFGTAVPIAAYQLQRQQIVAQRQHRAQAAPQSRSVRQTTLSNNFKTLPGNAIQTSGVISRVKVPMGWESKYVAEKDILLLYDKPQKAAITIMTIPQVANPVQAIQNLLKDGTAKAHLGDIQQTNVAGLQATSLKVPDKGQGTVWFLVADKGGLSVVVTSVILGDLSTLVAPINTVLTSMDFTPPSLPADLVGHYQERYQSSTGYGSDPVRIRSESRISLATNGVVSTNWRMTGGSLPTYLDGNEQASGGHWEARGNYLLLRKPNGYSNKYKYSVVPEGVALYDAEGGVTYLLRR